MRILQLCKKFPYPPKDGESIAIMSLSQALTQLGCQVTLLAMNTTKHYFDQEELPGDFSHYQEVHKEVVDNRIRWHEALVNLFRADSYHIARFDSSRFRRKLIALLQREEFDIIQLETLYLAPYIPDIRRYSSAAVVMRAHNVENEIWRRIADQTKWGPRKWVLHYLARKLGRYEVAQMQHYDLLAAISERDLQTFRNMGFRGEGQVIPVGIDLTKYVAPPLPAGEPLSIAFIGSLDWLPNQEGLKWFLDDIWRPLFRRYPRLQFHIAGRNMPLWVRRLSLPNVVVHGEVPNAIDFISKYHLLVVPLLSGSGMRVKILEAMALGKAVVTTRLGLEGIQARHRREVFLADTLAEFAAVIQQIQDRPEQLEKTGRRARELVARLYESQQVGRNLLATYSALTVEAI